MYGLKRYAKKKLPHRRDYYYRILFRRLSLRKLAGYFEGLGLKKGMVLFVHTAFSQLGYFSQGPVGLIELLKGLVGDQGTIAMPAFSFSGSAQDFVENKPFFDIVNTPSKSGYLTEVFRKYPGVVRSLHPTHSVCALGKYARDLVEGHEKTEGPCGANSPFGRLADLNAKILRIGTGSLSLYHHVQELVDFPNLFLPEKTVLPCKDYSENVVHVCTGVYRKVIPNILFLGEDTTTQKMNVHPSNFPLLYSGHREKFLRNSPKRQDVLTRLLKIRDNFEANGWLQKSKINGCKCELFQVKEYLDYAVSEEKKLIEAFKNKYDLSTLERLFMNGGYPGK